MKQRPRIYYSQAQKDEMWDRWQRGESLHEIARLTPVAWIMDGFQDIIIRGQGLEAIWGALVALPFLPQEEPVAETPAASGGAARAVHIRIEGPLDVGTRSLLQRAMPLDKPRGPETVAGVIAMLASEDGAHINGEYIRVDGGTLS